MKRYIRIVIDIIMFFLFILLMGYHITGNALHEVLGVITFVFFILHHIVNIKWYKMIFKGKYPFYRILQISIDVLLFLAMIGIIVSSILISSNVFSFLNIQTTMFGRNLHMTSTAWGFVLMAVHLGLHLRIVFLKISQKMKNNTFEYVYYLAIILFMFFGLYTFIDTELWKDLFLLHQFKFFDYDQNPILFYIGEFTIVCFISYTTYFLLKLKRKKK